MLWKISLYDLKPDADLSAFRQHETQMLPTYRSYFKALGQQYVGFYQVRLDALPGRVLTGFDFKASYAEVCLVEAAGVEEALLREASIPRSAELQEALNQRLSYVLPERRARLWLQPMVLSSFVQSPMSLRDRLLRIVLRNLPPNRKSDDLIAFDQRIIERYAAYMTQAKWQHIGLYHAFGLPDYMYADTFDLIDAGSIEEALANDAAVPITPEMQTIYDECDLYLDRSRERFVLWFIPFVSGLDALPALESSPALRERVSE